MIIYGYTHPTNTRTNVYLTVTQSKVESAWCYAVFCNNFHQTFIQNAHFNNNVVRMPHKLVALSQVLISAFCFHICTLVFNIFLLQFFQVYIPMQFWEIVTFKCFWLFTLAANTSKLRIVLVLICLVIWYVIIEKPQKHHCSKTIFSMYLWTFL